MKLLYIVLNDDAYLDNIVAALVEAEITVANVVEGQDLFKILSEDIPIFTGLLRGLSALKPSVKNIFAIVEKEEQIQEFLKILKSEGLDFEKGLGSLALIPIEFYLGSGPVI